MSPSPEELTLVLTGLQLSQWIELGSTTLLLYDHVINLDNEVEHFWSGPWSFSRGMYFCIRYLGLIQVTISILANSKVLTPVQSAFAFFSVAIASIALCQVAITIRVCCLFTHNLLIRSIALGAYVASTLSAALLSGMLWHDIRSGIPQPPQVPNRTPAIAWLFVPTLLFHSLLFGLKVYRFVTSPKYMKTDTFLWRFLKEGMVMYACALGSLLFIFIGLTKTDDSQIAVYEAAFNGGIVFVTLTTVSVCHAMLSIKSLAATLHVNPGWLLNHAELSRVHWRQGATEGEIVVESFDLPVVSALPRDAESTYTLSVDAKHMSDSARWIGPQP